MPASSAASMPATFGRARDRRRPGEPAAELDQEHTGELGAPAIAADLVIAAELELDHEHAGDLAAPATW
jgi:hypothetical protein